MHLIIMWDFYIFTENHFHSDVFDVEAKLIKIYFKNKNKQNPPNLNLTFQTNPCSWFKWCLIAKNAFISAHPMEEKSYVIKHYTHRVLLWAVYLIINLAQKKAEEQKSLAASDSDWITAM